jgi:hypothetical protein
VTFEEFWQEFIRLPDRETGSLVVPVPHLAQREVIEALDAVDPASELRRYPNVFLHWARKCSKDFILAAYTLYHLACDRFEHEPRYAAIAAWDREQTEITRRTAEQLIRRHPGLSQSFRVLRDQLVYAEVVRDARTGGEYTVEHLAEFLARDTKGSHGLQISLKVHNELWADRDPSFEEALTVSPSRRSPVTIYASYHGLKADMRPGVPLYDLLERVTEKDPAVFYSYIGGQGERAPQKVVPWITDRWIAEERKRLRHAPNRFNRMILNVPAGADQGLITADELKDAIDQTLPCLEYGTVGQRFTMAVDLGLSNDFAALALGTTDADARAVIARMESWSGTSTQPVDLQAVEDRIVDLCARFTVDHVTVDSWQAAHMVQRLQRRGVPAAMVTFEGSRMDRVITLMKGVFARRQIRIPATPGAAPYATPSGDDASVVAPRYQPNAQGQLVEQLESVKTTEGRIGKRDTLKFAPSGSGPWVGQHDDLVVALGLILEQLQSRVGAIVMDEMPMGCALRHTQPVECYLWGGMFVPTGHRECRECPGHLSTMRAAAAHGHRTGQHLPLREFVQAGLIKANVHVSMCGVRRATDGML